MPKRRASQKILEDLARQKLNASIQLRRSQVFSEGLDKDFWKSVVSYIQAKQKAVETELDGFKTMTQTEKDCLLQQRLDLRMFLAMPSDFARNQDLFDGRVMELSKQIKDYKERLKYDGDGGM